MAQKVYGVVRVMNTITQGTAVAGLEAGSAVFCKEATEAAREHYPGCIIAVTNHHVVGEQSNVMLNFHFSQTPFPASVLKVCPQYDLAFLHVNTDSIYFKTANFDHKLHRQRPIQLVSGSPIVYTDLDNFTNVTSVGFPSGSPHQTITRGNITAKDVIKDNIVLYHDTLINPGNSGGALLHEGKLVGINTAITTQPNTVSIATPFELVSSLIQYIQPQLKHPGMTPESFRQMLSMYHVSTPPDQLLHKFAEHECGGIEGGRAVSFASWFTQHCYNNPASHHLLQKVLTHLETDPSKIHKLRDEGWIKCANHSNSCEVIKTNVVPERIVFNDHFKVSTTVPILDKLTEKYGSEGVVITDALEHENLSNGQILVGIDGQSLDNFGNFINNGAPYFTAFKFHPGKTVRLNVASEEGIKSVDYKYTLVDKVPRIHAPQLTPFTPQALIKIGGLTITQMNGQMAAASYPKYLKAPHNNKVVGVVVQVDPLCAEWNVQKISPGMLLTKVNGKEMQSSIVESLQGANFVTFEGNGKSFIKLLV